MIEDLGRHRAWSMGHREIQLAAGRGRRSEVRDQKTAILMWERLSAAILRFQRLERFNYLTNQLIF